MVLHLSLIHISRQDDRFSGILHHLLFHCHHGPLLHTRHCLFLSLPCRFPESWTLSSPLLPPHLRDIPCSEAVSYTHLDVYKRQPQPCIEWHCIDHLICRYIPQGFFNSLFYIIVPVSYTHLISVCLSYMICRYLCTSLIAFSIEYPTFSCASSD